jgi:hypothetical protein
MYCEHFISDELYRKLYDYLFGVGDAWCMSKVHLVHFQIFPAVICPSAYGDLSDFTMANNHPSTTVNLQTSLTPVGPAIHVAAWPGL